MVEKPTDNPFVDPSSPEFDDGLAFGEASFDEVSALTDAAARRQVRQLREAIEFHDIRYYRDNDPAISDRQYDQLFKRLDDLESAFDELASPNSPTRRVGVAPLDELQRVDHVQTLLSLDAKFDADEVRAFDTFIRDNLDGEAYGYVCEPKFDGLSVEVIYEGGQLVRASTRGNGHQGELITDNVRTIRSLPLRLGGHYPQFLALRAEVLIPKSGFQRLNAQRVEQGQTPFANPRNAAAGSVRLLDSAEVARRPLDIFFYEVLDASELDLATECDALAQFRDWGLKVDRHSRRVDDVDGLEAFYDNIVALRDGLDFEIDGVVIKVDELGLRQKLGVRSRSPRWAMAWKFTPKKEITTLADIVVQVGRTGKLTPVALLEPVEVGGVTVSRATLHNLDELHAKDVRAGDAVRIQRAGDVIPEVVERIDDPGVAGRADPFEMPTHCPSCSAEIVQEGPHHYCPNGMSCPAQLKGRIAHFSARNALDIDGLGAETVQQLVQTGCVQAIPDLFELDVDTLVGLDGFAQTSATKLYDHIQAAKRVRIDRFLFALGIPMVGRHTAGLLAAEFGTLDALGQAGADRLQAVDGIGPQIAASVVDFFGEAQNQHALDRLVALGIDLGQMPDTSGDARLDDKTFVFTGGLDQMSRAQASGRVQDLGGRTTSSVSGATDYVVAGHNAGKKLDDARQRGVEILDEQQFLDLIDA